MKQLNRTKSIFVISIDFELMWGMLDLPHKEQYHSNILGVRAAIPRILELFKAFQIHATWATVGFLFFRTKEELLSALPRIKPQYKDRHLSPYEYLYTIGKNEEEDRLHFGASLIEKIMTLTGQEIETHTFSHFYCLEDGFDPAAFKADLLAAKDVALRRGITLVSLVFPKNQFNPVCLPILKEIGIKAYRGNAPSWIYTAAPGEAYTTLPKKAFRLFDAYLNLTGSNTYVPSPPHDSEPLNIPRSRFLRPYSGRLRWLEPLRLSRIKQEMREAAQSGRCYHLCLHPHNFGRDMEKNLSFLEGVLEHFSRLREETGMVSMNMKEVYEWVTHPVKANREA